MANNFRVSITGDKELQAKMKSISADLAAQAFAGAALTANKDMEDSIKNQIVSSGINDTGALERSIKRKRVIYPKSNTVVVVTGIASDAKRITTENGKTIITAVARYGAALDNKFKFIEKGAAIAKPIVEQKFVANLKRRIKNILG